MVLQNYSGILQVLSALQGTPVQRLIETWAAIDHRFMKQFQEFCNIFQPLYNWRRARELLRTNQPPLVPFIGTLSWILDNSNLALQASTLPTLCTTTRPCPTRRGG